MAVLEVGKKPTILIIDDSPEVRSLCTMLLEGAGYRVLSSASVTCLDLIFGEQPQLILLDVQMPGIGGETAARILLRERQGIRGKIVFHSAEDESALARRSQDVGVDGFLTKGLPPGAFLKSVHGFMPADPSRSPAPGAPTDGTSAQGAKSGQRVLVIDDSSTFLKIVSRHLTGAGYQVIPALSGETGLQLAASELPDVVVVDGKLPGIDGSTMIQRMRSVPALRLVPSLLMTAVTGDQEEVVALDSGADAFWRKSEHMDLLVARVQAILRSRGAPEAPLVGGQRTILIVDDSPTVLEQTAGLFEQEGFHVETASSGDQAIRLLTNTPVDVVLLDLVMPGMSGEETCRRIRALPSLRDLPILVLTSQDDSRSLIEGINAGADDAVRKTADFEVMHARVRALVRRRHNELEARHFQEARIRRETDLRQARTAEELADTRAKLLADLEEKNRELELARRRAEETSFHKSAFLANMSHEIRTPMNAVIGMTSLLMGTTLTREQREYVETIRGSGEHLLVLINDILDFSKVEAGELVIEAYRFSLAACVEEAMDLVRSPAREKGLTLAFTPVGPLPGAVTGDAGRLRQILLNLLSNAIKFTEKGRVEVELAVQPVEGGKIQAAFRVKDSGIGMNHEVIARLFRPFVQGEVSTTRHYGGTGLGLAISRRLAELMGGGIRVTSEVGVGSIFHFEVVMEASEGVAPVTHVTEASASTLFDPELARRFPLSILVAEDNPINQRVAEGMLSKLGYRPDLVGNGIEAVEAVRRQHYDLILMDMRMPVMDGMAATRAIREIDRPGPRPCIIALTASIVDIDSESIREIGLDDLVLKPVTPESLMNAIARMQARGQTGDGGAHPETAVVTPAADEPAAVDTDSFESLANLLEPAELIEILDLFLGRTMEQFDVLHAAVGIGDWGTVRSLGHELSPVCASLGALNLSGMTKEIENIAAGGGVADAGPRATALIREAGRVRDELQRLRDARAK